MPHYPRHKLRTPLIFPQHSPFPIPQLLTTRAPSFGRSDNFHFTALIVLARVVCVVVVAVVELDDADEIVHCFHSPMSRLSRLSRRVTIA